MNVYGKKERVMITKNTLTVRNKEKKRKKSKNAILIPSRGKFYTSKSNVPEIFLV